MIKSIIFGSVLLIAVSDGRYQDFDNNLVGFEVPGYYNSLGEYEGRIYPPPSPYPIKKGYIKEPVLYEAVAPIPVPVEESTVVEVSKPGIIATIATKIFSLVKASVKFLIFKLPAIFIGVIGALGLCKLTPICGDWGALSLLNLNDLKTIANSERIAGATDFVKRAVRKYRSMQD